MSAAPNNSVVSVSENIFISSDYDADLFPHRKKTFFSLQRSSHMSCVGE